MRSTTAEMKILYFGPWSTVGKEGASLLGSAAEKTEVIRRAIEPEPLIDSGRRLQIERRCAGGIGSSQ
jgi:hypothetical protein